MKKECNNEEAAKPTVKPIALIAAGLAKYAYRVGLRVGIVCHGGLISFFSSRQTKE